MLGFMCSALEQKRSVSRANRYIKQWEVPVIKNENRIKNVNSSNLSLTVGIACASPLLVTELNIRPWINQVQGVTAQFEVKVVYANFTLQNGDKPVTQDSGPTISYFAVVNITNLSNLLSLLRALD